MNLEKLQNEHRTLLQHSGLAFKQFLRTKQEENVFCIKENDIRRYAEKGVLKPHIRPTGGWWYFYRNDIEQIIPLLNSTEEDRLRHALESLKPTQRNINRSGWAY